MKASQRQLDWLTGIFEKTFHDKNISRGEKTILTQMLSRDVRLDKQQRDLMRSKLFEIARGGMQTHTDREILDWLDTASKLLLNRQDSAAYFSPGDNCRAAIVDQIKQTSISLDICVFTISDDRITSEILFCKDRGVDVRIITDDEKAYDRGSDIHMISEAGIEVRVDDSPSHMHHKFAIFDNERLLTGSYNWTRSAAEKNQENVIVSDDKRPLAAYKEEFEKLWNSFKNYHEWYRDN